MHLVHSKQAAPDGDNIKTSWSTFWIQLTLDTMSLNSSGSKLNLSVKLFFFKSRAPFTTSIQSGIETVKVGTLKVTFPPSIDINRNYVISCITSTDVISPANDILKSHYLSPHVHIWSSNTTAVADTESFHFMKTLNAGKRLCHI